MQGTSAGDWLEHGRAQLLRGEAGAALATFEAGCAAHPAEPELRVALAGLAWQLRRSPDAERHLREVLDAHPGDAAAAFLLARILREQGRMLAVETALRALFARPQPAATLLQAIDMLADCARQQAASDLVEHAIANGSDDARLHAYAGMLAVQLGDFERAHARYAHALARDARALEWQAPYGLASSRRHQDAGDPDFDLLRGLSARNDLSPAARASIGFGLGKAFDDIGDVAQAAVRFREANALVAASAGFQPKAWRRMIAARLDAKAGPALAVEREDFAPVFVIGMPRSGTTLVADRLARHPDVCNRGELNWIAQLASDLGRVGRPGHGALVHAAHAYVQQVRQDDTDARWFVDKQPLNFLHVDLIVSLFPNARVIVCRRSARDTALSIWMQYFAGRAQDFAYDFAHIEAVMHGCARLVEAAHRRHPTLVRDVRYEDFVADPVAHTRALADWIGLPAHDWSAAGDERRVISTSSAWQARQPVHTRSIGRWQAYAPHVPELLRFDV